MESEYSCSKFIETKLSLKYNIYLSSNREFCEISSKAFIHTDLVGQTFLCYLLQRSCKLQMVRLNHCDNNELQITSVPLTVVAKDAVALQVFI